MTPAAAPKKSSGRGRKSQWLSGRTIGLWAGKWLPGMDDRVPAALTGKNRPAYTSGSAGGMGGRPIAAPRAAREPPRSMSRHERYILVDIYDGVPADPEVYFSRQEALHDALGILKECRRTNRRVDVRVFEFVDDDEGPCVLIWNNGREVVFPDQDTL